jgi:hypothetical protein
MKINPIAARIQPLFPESIPMSPLEISRSFGVGLEYGSGASQKGTLERP